MDSGKLNDWLCEQFSRPERSGRLHTRFYVTQLTKLPRTLNTRTGKPRMDRTEGSYGSTTTCLSRIKCPCI